MIKDKKYIKKNSSKQKNKFLARHRHKIKDQNNNPYYWNYLELLNDYYITKLYLDKATKYFGDEFPTKQKYLNSITSILKDIDDLLNYANSL